MVTQTKEVGYEKKLYIPNAPYLRGQNIPSVDPHEEEGKYLLGTNDNIVIYSNNRDSENYKAKIRERLLSQGYKYLVSIIDPLDEESYRECGANIDYTAKGIIAYMLLEDISWLHSARLFFYENFENLPDTHIVNNVWHSLAIPGVRKKKEIETNGGKYVLRQSKLKAIHTFATESLDNLEW